MITFNFDGHDYSGDVTVHSIEGRGTIASDSDNVVIDGVDGSYITQRRRKERLITIDVSIQATSVEALRKAVDEFNGRIDKDTPGVLVFTDEPDMEYFAYFVGDISWKEDMSYAFASLEFVCPDPHKYGPEKYSTSTTFTVGGTAPTPPVISVELKSAAAFVAVSNGVTTNLVGNPMDIAVTPIERLTRTFWSQADSLVGWTAPTSAEGTAITGTMMTDGYHFKPSAYGTGTMWHGPALKTSIPAILKDFQVDTIVELTNLVGGQARVGRVVVSALDQAGNVIGSLAVINSTIPSKPRLVVRAGNEATGKEIINFSGEGANILYNNFYGILRIGRKSGVWFAYVAKMDRITGKHDSGKYFETQWKGSDNVIAGDISQVQVQASGYGTHPVALGGIEDVKVFRINDMTPVQIPYIGQAGDIIEFDNQQYTITRNGEDITTSKAFVGDYFSVNPGRSTIAVEPASAIQNIQVRWRDKWR